MSRLVGYGVSQVPTNGMLGGMAYQNSSNVSVGNISADSYDNGLWTSEKTFNVSFPSGTAHQKVQIYWPTGSRLQGGYEVTIAVGYAYANASGMLRKAYGVQLQESGVLYVQKTTIPFTLGNTASWFTISDFQWDSVNSRWYIIIANLAGTATGSAINSGNDVTISVRSYITPAMSSVWLNARASAASISPIYTTDTSVYPILSAPIVDNYSNFIIGAATSTGTASQRLQVNSGAYISGSVGIGVTNPVGLTTGSVETLHLNGENAVLRVGPYYTTQGDRDAVLLVSNGTDSYVRCNNERFHIYNNSGDIVVHTGTNDPEILRITSAGNIGIGITTPQSKFQVNDGVISVYNGSAGTISTCIQFFPSPIVNASNTGQRLEFRSDVINAYIEGVREVQNGPVMSMRFGTFFGEAIRIAGNSVSVTNVGIGSTIPQYKLDIAGGDINLPLGNSIRFDGTSRISCATGGVQNLPLTQLLAAAGISTVELNTGSSTNTLRIAAGVNVRGGLIEFNAGTASIDPGTLKFFTGTTASQNIPPERMRIFSTGEVGIGNTVLTGTASQPLQVTGGAYVSGNLGIGITNPSTVLDIFTPGIAGIAYPAIISASGNGGAGRGVGISIRSPGSGSRVETVRLIGLQETASATANDASFAIQVANTSGTLTERLRINSSGNLGIGSITPTSKLTVVDTTDSVAAVTVNISNSDANNERLGVDVVCTTSGSGSLGTNVSLGLFRGTYTGYTGFEHKTLNLVTNATQILGTSQNGYSIYNVTQFPASGSSVDFNQYYYNQYNYLNLNATLSNTGANVGYPTRYFGIYSKVDAPNSENQKVYNLYLENGGTPSSTSNWAIYQNTSTTPNYFAGNIGIGTLNPGQALEVVGTINSKGDASTIVHYQAQDTGAAVDEKTWRIAQVTRASKSLFLGLSVNDAANTAYAPITIVRNGVSLDNIQFATGNGLERLRINSTGNIGIGTTNPTYKLHVVGSFGATTKSFIIDHPTKEGKKLQYGSLEGPENGVYVRGRSQDTQIELPEYWTKLIDAETITVNLTPIGNSASPRVEKVLNNVVYVFTKEEGDLDYYYTVFAERCDVDKLKVEI